MVTLNYLNKKIFGEPTWDVDEEAGSTPESKPLKRKSRFSLKEVFMAKGWLVEAFANFADAVLLVLEMKGMNISFGLGITRLVFYAVQIVSAILLGGRPRPKSASLFKALLNCRAFCLLTGAYFTFCQ